MTFTTDELRTVTILAGLPEWQLAWFGAHGVRIELAPGDHMFERGQSSDYMFIVVRGAIQRYEERAGNWIVVATTKQGEVTGMLPYSRMTHYPGYTVATEPSLVLRVNQNDFPEMLLVSREIGRRLVSVMADRVRGDVRLEQQRERMAALGRLSAGLAHELNNPAAAVRRAAASLAEALARSAASVVVMQRQGGDTTVASALERLQRLTHEPREDRGELSPLERSQREETLDAWLDHCGVECSWEMAVALVDAGLGVDDLRPLVDGLPPGLAPNALAWVGWGLAADRLVGEIASAAARISELIASVKNYSHMGRSPEQQTVDVREGLGSTLTMLSHKLRRKNVRVVRRDAENLPSIAANAGELNQVWTNLLDNAIDALNDGGELRVEAIPEDVWVVVRIIDDGHGIPDDIRSRIFEPFFSTKAVGEGTGLGLDIALRIVETHSGHIEVESRPGHTKVVVRLPVGSSR